MEEKTLDKVLAGIGFGFLFAAEIALSGAMIYYSTKGIIKSFEKAYITEFQNQNLSPDAIKLSDVYGYSFDISSSD